MQQVEIDLLKNLKRMLSSMNNHSNDCRKKLERSHILVVTTRELGEIHTFNKVKTDYCIGVRS